MAFHTFRIDRRLTPGSFYLDHQDYGQSQPSHIDDALGFEIQPLIDPNLEHVETPTLGTISWPEVNTHQLQQYMNGPSTSFFALRQYQANYMYPHHDVSPLPPVSQGRHGSPFSQHNSSSSSDSLSPPTESDKLPATPPDTTATSPFLQTSKFQQPWDTQPSHVYVLAGIASTQGAPYVNLLDINPSQEIFEDERTMDYDGSMALSLSSAGSQSGMETQIKDEICVIDSQAQTTYPDPDCEDRDQSEPEADVVVTKYDDEDKDWTPPKPTRKRTRSDASKTPNISPRPARKRAKLDAPTQAALKSGFTAPHSTKRTFPCTDCAVPPFRDEAALQKHIKAKHIRPFVCIFNFAGCSSSFPSKNEWKRHVVTQHLALSYWHCKQDSCERCTDPFSNSQQASTNSSGTSTPSPLPRGAIFNRKDLYTQHVRRMHVPPSIAKALRQKKPSPDWDDRLRQMQVEAERRRCDLPTHMQCPAAGCGMVFGGSGAWDERMEHVAKHLEKVAEGREQMLPFGGDEDPTLTMWAASPEVGVVRKTAAGGWELMNPLRGQASADGGFGKRGAKATSRSWSSDVKDMPDGADYVDADGEED